MTERKLCKDCKYFYAYKEIFGLDRRCRRPNLVDGLEGFLDPVLERGQHPIYDRCGPEAKYFEAGEYPLMEQIRVGMIQQYEA